MRERTLMRRRSRLRFTRRRTMTDEPCWPMAVATMARRAAAGPARQGRTPAAKRSRARRRLRRRLDSVRPNSAVQAGVSAHTAVRDALERLWDLAGTYRTQGIDRQEACELGIISALGAIAVDRGMRMTKDRPSLQDQIRRRQQSGFVGRQIEVVQFEDNLELPVDDPARSFLFNVYGDAGVGKTYLTKRFRQVATGNGYLTAYIDETVVDAVSAMTAISADFTKQGIRLEEFEKGIATYRRRRHEVEADSNAPDGVAAFLTKTAVAIGLAAARDVPVAGSLLAPIDASAAADQANQVRKYLVQKFGDHGDAQLLLSPEDQLTPLFVSDLNRVASNHSIALFVDTYERTGLILDEWLRRLYDGRYGDLPETLITTISGQMILDPSLWVDYLPIIADIHLEPFTEAEALVFLAGKNIHDQSTVEVILTLSGRLPLWLATLAEAKPESASEVGDPAGNVVERFLKWEDDPTRRDVAMAAAFPRILNQDVLTAISPGNKTQELFNWLCRLPFVSRRSSHWEYHEVVRGAMLRLQLAQAPAGWQASHMALADTYERWAKEAADKSGNTWLDGNWVDCKREELYHRLCADPINSLEMALASAVEAAEHSNVRLRQWAQLIIDASRDTGDSTLSQYGQRLDDLIKGSDSALAMYFAKPDVSSPVTSSAKENQERNASSQTRQLNSDMPRGSTTRRTTSVSARPARGKQNRQIAMLGSPASGKTTFLSALAWSLAQGETGWNITPEDEISADYLVRMTASLSTDRIFPLTTPDVVRYGWTLNGWSTRVTRTRFRKKVYKEPVRLGLQVMDVPGEILHSSWVGTAQRAELINTIAPSDGIVFLIDPIRELELGDTSDFIFGSLAQLMQRTSYETGAPRSRLPHYVAVCLTKFDDPRVFTVADRLGLLSQSPDDPYGFPRVSDDRARDFIYSFLDSSPSGDGSTIVQMLETYCNPERINYYVTSAIGFFINPTGRHFSPNDPINLVPDEQGRSGAKIRSTPHPINVAEPLIWLCDTLTSGKEY